MSLQRYVASLNNNDCCPIKDFLSGSNRYLSSLERKAPVPIHSLPLGREWMVILSKA